MPVIRIHDDTLARLDARYGKQYPRGEAIAMLVDEYEGIRDQDGWETLELTLRSQHPQMADDVLKALEEDGSMYPVRIQMERKAMDELHSCEYGSYEDHIHDDSRDEPYHDGTLHIIELIERSPYKTVVWLQNQAEVDEFFGQACTGTFGMYHTGVCFRIYDQLLPLVSEQAAKAVNRGTIGY